LLFLNYSCRIFVVNKPKYILIIAVKTPNKNIGPIFDITFIPNNTHIINTVKSNHENNLKSLYLSNKLTFSPNIYYLKLSIAPNIYIAPPVVNPIENSKPTLPPNAGPNDLEIIK